MNPISTARTSLIALMLLAITLASNPANAQAPAKKGPPPPPTTKAKLPDPPPADPIDEINAALTKINGRLDKIEGRLDKVEGRLDATEKASKATDKKVATTDGKVAKLETRVRRLEERPPLTRVEYVRVYGEPETYLYYREPGILSRKTYTYVDGKLHIFVTTSSTWCLVTK